jgi:hypothetical protein
MQHGKGTHWFVTGERYEGDWVTGKRNGYGVNYFVTGERYEG